MASDFPPNTDIEVLRGWIGRQVEEVDLVTPAKLAGVSAWLDHPNPPWPRQTLPPLGHWFCFLPQPRQSELDEDGHLRRGSFLPPVPLPRRMWAGSRVEFYRPVPIPRELRLTTAITDVVLKTGVSGVFVKVTLNKEVFDGETLAIREAQDIVYRPPADATASPPLDVHPVTPKAFDYQRTVALDSKLLFRFSALTANVHRIHYDRDYARNIEGYPGLVVHGPMQAVLLLDHYLRNHPGFEISHFSCRAQRPLFDTANFVLKGSDSHDGAVLWTEDAAGRTCLEAQVVAAVRP